MKYSEIKIQPLKGGRYKLLEEVTYKDITVPVGYRTNGGDIPSIFWVLFPPYKPDYLPAVIIHDYLCDLEEYSKADDYFEEILQGLYVSKFTVFAFSKAVRFYHYLMKG